MKVLIADKTDRSVVTALEGVGCEVSFQPKLTADDLAQAIAEFKAQVLVVRSTKVKEKALQCKSLELVVRAGAGVDNIDGPAAAANGVFVANCPGKNAVAVAELAFGLLLSLDRKIPDNVIATRRGAWDKKGFAAQGLGIKGKTLGLVGFGSIGQETAKFGLAFGMTVVVWSRSLTQAKAKEHGVIRCESALDVARLADVVSVHLALNQDTRDFIGQEFFVEMKDGAFFINTSRSEIVNEDALVKATIAKNLRVGTDVPANEPTGDTYDGPLKAVPGDRCVYVTHHIGASTQQAQEAVAEEAVRVVKVFKSTGAVANCVNLRVNSKARAVVTVRHRDTVGVLAGVLTQVRDAGYNVQEMENTLFDGADVASARIRVDRPLPESLMNELEKSPSVLCVSQVTLS